MGNRWPTIHSLHEVAFKGPNTLKNLGIGPGTPLQAPAKATQLPGCGPVACNATAVRRALENTFAVVDRGALTGELPAESTRAPSGSTGRQIGYADPQRIASIKAHILGEATAETAPMEVDRNSEPALAENAARASTEPLNQSEGPTPMSVPNSDSDSSVAPVPPEFHLGCLQPPAVPPAGSATQQIAGRVDSNLASPPAGPGDVLPADIQPFLSKLHDALENTNWLTRLCKLSWRKWSLITSGWKPKLLPCARHDTGRAAPVRRSPEGKA